MALKGDYRNAVVCSTVVASVVVAIASAVVIAVGAVVVVRASAIITSASSGFQEASFPLLEEGVDVTLVSFSIIDYA